MKKICVIVLTFNGQPYIADCLHSLLRADRPDLFDILVVDNHSTDGTLEILKRDFPTVDTIENSANLGFAGGNNIGMKRALEKGASYVVLLNQDTEVANTFIVRGFEYMETHPTVGLAGPVILYPQERRIWFAGSKIYRGREILTYPYAKIGDHIGKKEIFRPEDGKNPADWIPACALFIRAELLKTIGFLDETFFMYGEDVDFNFRAKNAGFNIAFFSDTFVIHKENISRPQLNKKMIIRLGRKLAWRTKGRFKIVSRYFTPTEKMYYFFKLLLLPFLKLWHVVTR